jgi:hypothetical protein
VDGGILLDHAQQLKGDGIALGRVVWVLVVWVLSSFRWRGIVPPGQLGCKLRFAEVPQYVSEALHHELQIRADLLDVFF